LVVLLGIALYALRIPQVERTSEKIYSTHLGEELLLRCAKGRRLAS
jgi:hypothetical protein